MIHAQLIAVMAKKQSPWKKVWLHEPTSPQSLFRTRDAAWHDGRDGRFGFGLVLPMSVALELEDTSVAMQRIDNVVMFKFGNCEDAEKFFIGFHEAARMGTSVEICFKPRATEGL